MHESVSLNLLQITLVRFFFNVSHMEKCNSSYTSSMLVKCWYTWGSNQTPRFLTDALCGMAKPSNHSETFWNSLWSRFEPITISSVFPVLSCRKFYGIQLFTAARQVSTESLGSTGIKSWVSSASQWKLIPKLRITSQGKHVDCKKQWTKDRPLCTPKHSLPCFDSEPSWSTNCVLSVR